MLQGAEVSFGIPGDNADQLRRLVRRSRKLRVVQATAAGAGQQAAAAGLSEDDLARVAIASSSGVHAGPLAEFALLGVLALLAAPKWEHYPVRDVAGRTVGDTRDRRHRIPYRTARQGHRHACDRGQLQRETAGRAGAEYCAADRLAELAPRADVLVITLPETRDTAGIVHARVLAALPAGAVVVNVGRDRVADEGALIELLQAGRLAGAALDVTAKEPPDPDSLLWDLPNVILSPHTAALSPHENERIVDLFIDNVRPLDSGHPVRNRITAARRD